MSCWTPFVKSLLISLIWDSVPWFSQLPGETEIICNNNWLVNEDHHDGECDGTDSASQERKPVESDSITVNPPADRAEYDPGNDQLQVSFKEGISKKKWV